MTLDDEKRAAAIRAVAEVESGMVVGLGSGSTATHAAAALAERVRLGLRVRCIATSVRTAALAARLGLAATDFSETRRVDIDIDGADVIERGSLTLVKGKGGALFREKIVALASRRMLVIADHTKLVDRIGAGTRIPVEVAAFGYETVLDRLAAAGLEPRLRRAGDAPFVTDGGNLIADCALLDTPDIADLAQRLKAIAGVVETGLFVGIASAAFIGRGGTVEAIGR